MTETLAEVEARTGTRWWATRDGWAAYEAQRATRAPATTEAQPPAVASDQTPEGLDELHQARLRAYECAACGRDLNEIDAQAENPSHQRVTCDSTCRQRLSRLRKRHALGPLV